MQLTDCHAKYYAHELTKRCPSDSVEKLAASLIDAQVDLNPHQVEAALFAFKSPLSMGAILADEVGLGKTIEAGMVKAWFPLTTKVEKVEMAGKEVFSIAEGALLICLDSGFKNNDQLKANAVQTFKARNRGKDKESAIVFRTV